MNSCSEEESRGNINVSLTNQSTHHITAAVDDGDGDGDDDDDDDDDNDDDDGDDDDGDLPVEDDESHCLPFRNVGDYSDDEGGDDQLLLRSVEDLEATDHKVMDNSYSDDTLYLRDVPSPSQQRLHSRDDQGLLDDDRPHFTPISKVSAIIDHFNSSMTTPSVAHHQESSITPTTHHQESSITPSVAHHQVSLSLTTHDMYSALVENVNYSYLLDSNSSNVSTQSLHGVSLPCSNSVSYIDVTPLMDKGCLHTTAAVPVEIKGGTVSPLSVESADCNAATIRRSYSRRQLSYQLVTTGLEGEEVVDEDRVVDHRFNQFVASVATCSTEGHLSRPFSITTTAAIIVCVLHAAAVIGLALLVSAIISLTNMAGSMIASIIMVHIYLLLTPWRWMLLALKRVSLVGHSAASIIEPPSVAYQVRGRTCSSTE